MGQPDVSVIVPVFNGWTATRACLTALLRVDAEIALQIIVVDDCSEDETAVQLSRLVGIDVLRNGTNKGYLISCNRGATMASAPYLYFLNNDTLVRDGAVRALLECMSSDATIAVVGSKLVYPDGRLQEAGGIIWADGSGCNVGRGEDPNLPRYAFSRDVDYVSGASMLVRASFFRARGGFDARFAPAYYEDADICFAARADGFRVVYESGSLVVHAEGLSSGTDPEAGIKRFQNLNRLKFLEKWRPTLERDHMPPDGGTMNVAALRRGRHRANLLILDLEVPKDDRDAGGQRMWRLIEGFQERGYRVTFFPDDLKAVAPYARRLQRAGTEVLYRLPDNECEPAELLRGAAGAADAVWISRPLVCRKYLHLVRSMTSAPIVYDTVDLHHIRLEGQRRFESSANGSTWREWKQIELASARAADGAIAVTEAEAQILREADVRRVDVVPTIHDPIPRKGRPYTSTSGFLFIGGYLHRPNVDGAVWLVRKIMPSIWSRRPDIRLTLLGADPPAEISSLANDRVLVPGYVADVADFFLSARVFVAPLRYGAGVKGKIGQALSYGLPIVTTTVGADGFSFENGVTGMIADMPDAFADAALEVYEDRELWSRLASNAFSLLEPFTSANVLDRAVAFVDELVADQRLANEKSSLSSVKLGL
jgi:O-antigen biosynthesis protein